jgi:hypothetical protein
MIQPKGEQCRRVPIAGVKRRKAPTGELQVELPQMGIEDDVFPVVPVDELE